MARTCRTACQKRIITSVGVSLHFLRVRRSPEIMMFVETPLKLHQRPWKSRRHQCPSRQNLRKRLLSPTVGQIHDACRVYVKCFLTLCRYVLGDVGQRTSFLFHAHIALNSRRLFCCLVRAECGDALGICSRYSTKGRRHHINMPRSDNIRKRSDSLEIHVDSPPATWHTASRCSCADTNTNCKQWTSLLRTRRPKYQPSTTPRREVPFWGECKNIEQKNA